MVMLKTPEPDHTVVVHTPGTPDPQAWLTSSTGGMVMAVVVCAILAVTVFRHLPKWVVAVGLVVVLLAAGIITLNPKVIGG